MGDDSIFLICTLFKDKLDRPWKTKRIVLLQGDQDLSVGQLDNQKDYIRKFAGDAFIEAKEIQAAAHNLCGERESVLQEIASSILK